MGRHSADGIVGHIVTAICGQTNGNLYVGGGWGISQFSNGSWTRLPSAPGSRIREIEEIPIRKLATGHDGSLWAATSWGALHRRQSTWTLYTDPDTAEKLRQNQSLQFLNIELLPETVITRLRSGSLPVKRCDFNEVVADGQGRIWLGTSGGRSSLLRRGPGQRQSRCGPRDLVHL
jgi:ligand-binding sensor domain-containing protein